MKHGCVAIAGMLVTAALGAPAAAVEIAPSVVVLTSRAQSELLTVTDRGEPVPASSIGAVQFLVGDHAYNHMINVERTDGGIILRPTEELEIGTYTLQVAVGGTRVAAEVRATLVNEPDSIESRAAQEGLTPEQYRRQLGLYRTGRQAVEIVLPEWYYVGRQVRFEMPAFEQATYEWRVNGEIVESGSGPHVFSFTFRRPGEYRFEYVERLPNGETVHSTAVTHARDPEPATVHVDEGGAVHLQGPRGFANYTWLVDGVAVSEAADLTHTFERPGDYQVECIASGGSSPESTAFQKVIYRVIVR